MKASPAANPGQSVRSVLLAMAAAGWLVLAPPGQPAEPCAPVLARIVGASLGWFLAQF